MTEKRTPRRSFMKNVGLSAATGLLASGTGLPPFAYASNETLNIGCIGTGGRALRTLMVNLKRIPGVRITAICDVWDHHLALAQELTGPQATKTKNYREVLERKDIDAVVIATPDHWHVPITVEACAAGKDVYVEKPLTHDLSEGPKVIEAQNRHQRIVQVGMQQRSMPHIQKAYQLVQSGAVGKIHKVHLTWNRTKAWTRRHYGIDPKSVDWKMFLGSAREQPFDEYRFRVWRAFWDFGGGLLTDTMVHWIDVVNWFCGLDHPATAVAVGDHFQTKGFWETPDTIQTILHYPDQQVQAYFEGTYSNARNGAMIDFMGTNGTLYLDRGRYEIHPARGKRKYMEWKPGGNQRGADFYDGVNGGLLHLKNWVECIRSRKRPAAPAEAGVAAASGAHLGNRAYLTGQTAQWGENG